MDYGSRRWQVFRLEALKRDGFKCTRCSSRHRLVVDHVLDVRSHPELALVLHNVRTLCAGCDNKRHREKGHSGRPWGCDVNGVPLDPQHHWNRESQHVRVTSRAPRSEHDEPRDGAGPHPGAGKPIEGR